MDLEEAKRKGFVRHAEGILAPRRDELLRWLEEDLGTAGDLTTQAVLSGPVPARARLVAREGGIVAGLAEAIIVAQIAGFQLTPEVAEGARVEPGATLAAVTGDARAILPAERLILNIVGRTSGIATETRRIQDVLHAAGPQCRVAGTRKTTPGFRRPEKRAIALGGGDPHRWGLFDAVLVKDNHVAAAGSVALAVKRAQEANPTLEVECEADSLEQAVQAARAGAQWVLLDNMGPAKAREAAAAATRVNAGLRIEVSGGIREEDLGLYAPFAHRVSLGRLTHSARSLDVGLDWEA